jgi:transposase
MVSEVANKLQEGVQDGSKKNNRKQIKYTISLTDLLPSSVEVFTKQEQISEDIAIPQVVFKNIDKKQDNIFVFDRGVQSRKQFCRMDEEEIRFVTRVRTVARHEVIRSYDVPEGLRVGNLEIFSDQKVFLFNKHSKVEHLFRLIKTMNEKNEPLWFLTNDFSLPIDEIISIYKRRWDIEVFFRFIKQELNFKHFISTNVNGIKIILYMTLILAMMILIYKKLNNIGYHTAKRRFYYELEGIILRMVATLSGGDPNLVFR